MKLWGIGLSLFSWVVSPPQPAVPPTPTVHTTRVPAAPQQAQPSSVLIDGLSSWLVAAEPSKADVQLLRQAFAEFYGVDRDLQQSEALLSEVIDLWASQPADERAALYRVRGDCYTLLGDAGKARADYQQAIELLRTPTGQAQADPSELPAALLGRARAIKASGDSSLTPTLARQAATDYEQYLKLTSREEWDTDQELLEDGALRNPYAAWEMGAVLRVAGQYRQASTAHALAAQAFAEIGDKARSVVSLFDAGIDAAGANRVDEATELLQKAIKQTPGVSANDVGLLQRVIAKEGEGRLALAALLWNDSNTKDGKAQAEKVLGDACVRLEQMQAQQSKGAAPKSISSSSSVPTGLRFSIDDALPSVMDVSCYKFKNPAFLEQLAWPADLQKKVINLETLR